MRLAWIGWSLMIISGCGTAPDLARLGESKAYYGAYVAGAPMDLGLLNAFERVAGKRVAILMWYQGWGAKGKAQRFQSAWMNAVRGRGSMPMITWEPWEPGQGADQPSYRLRNIIDGKFDGYLSQWAKDAAAWGHPFFIKLAHEMNGDWYPWSERTNGNHPGEYVLAWKHIHDLFKKYRVKNVTWVWAPNVELAGGTPLSNIYPGPDYVDWTALDGFNWGSSRSGSRWQSFTEIFGASYRHVLNLAPSKPIMISETASSERGGDKAAWISDTYGKYLPLRFPRIRAVIWFDENKETDWRIQSSESAQSAFATGVSSPYYAPAKFRGLSQAPIPPPRS